MTDKTTFDPLGIFSLPPAAKRLQSVMDVAEQVRAEQQLEQLQLNMERERLGRIEREEIARLSARAKWEASQQPPQTTPTPERPRILLDLRPGLKERSAQLRDRANAVETARLAKLAELEAERDFHKSEAARKQAAPAQAAAVPAPVVADSASNAPDAQNIPMKKAALIAALEHEWGSIEADLSEATRNGLKVAAHAGTHGEWYASKARAWAVSKGKIRQAAAPVIHPAIWPGTVTRNRI